MVSVGTGLARNASIVVSDGCRPGGGYGAIGDAVLGAGGDFLGARTVRLDGIVRVKSIFIVEVGSNSSLVNLL